jgi:hypothetical protein
MANKSWQINYNRLDSKQEIVFAIALLFNNPLLWGRIEQNLSLRNNFSLSFW